MHSSKLHLKKFGVELREAAAYYLLKRTGAICQLVCGELNSPHLLLHRGEVDLRMKLNGIIPTLLGCFIAGTVRYHPKIMLLYRLTLLTTNLKYSGMEVST
jgi:hypothetical protein